MLTEELFTYLFDGQPHLLAEPVRTWLESSRRFAAFASTFRNKIRKKLRVTQDQETLHDLRLELETAYLLLQERTLSVAYEPEQSRQVRSPDFGVTYTTSLTFMVEVTRLRGIQERTSAQAQEQMASSSDNERLIDAIYAKLGQLLPQCGNVLIIGMDAPRLLQNDLHALMLWAQQRVERSDSAFWERYRFRDRADFFRHYQRLSEVLVRGSQLQAEEPVLTWVNPQAKHPLPGKVRTVLYRTFSH